MPTLAARFGSGLGLAVALGAMWFAIRSTLAMTVLVAGLGALTYAAVPALQARVIGMAERHAPKALAAAAGLNIAGSNAGIALGSLVGGGVIGTFGLTATALVGATTAGGLVAFGMQFSSGDERRADHEH